MPNRIYHSPVRRGRLIELFVATGPDVVDRLRRTFSERVPQPTSGSSSVQERLHRFQPTSFHSNELGLFFDENVTLDPLRGVRSEEFY